MKKSTFLLVLVAALGYFVDAYDLILFVVLRHSSLSELGVAGNNNTSIGLWLFNVQMIGLLLGGIFFGVLGDKKGRLSVLFGSIVLYSVATIINGFVTDIYTYGALRFLAGIGLAGELGAGITIVAETMPKEKRGYGTMIMASVGAFGAVVAALVGDAFYWRTAYFIGGGMGLLLLLLRIGTFESKMFKHAETLNVSRGDFLSLFTKKDRFRRYIACMFIGFPIFFIVSILMQLAPEVAKALGVEGKVTAGQAVMYVYIGLTCGDLISGYVSQLLRNRRKTIFIFQAVCLCMCLIYLNLWGASNTAIFVMCVLMGTASGYWIVLITMAAEQFGTNMRATVATTIPNFARGGAVPISICHQYLTEALDGDLITSATIIGIFCFGAAFIANATLKETFAKDLDFVE
ncbi:MFS transporter [Emticicia fluvialis]|uniref:MFS transporter n=1 Tax=Emticicia fluvialis TaxID=2974474 RepID=UPI0021652784|nr:MFS transporter [Emticicia fluvialis]